MYNAIVCAFTPSFSYSRLATVKVDAPLAIFTLVSMSMKNKERGRRNRR